MPRRAALPLAALLALAAPLPLAAQGMPGWAVARPGAALAAEPGAAADRAVEADEILTRTGREAEADGTLWAEISQGDGPDLWIQADALSPAPLETFEGSLAPVAGICAGSEPSWSVRWGAEGLTLRLDLDPDPALPFVAAAPVGWRHGLLLAEGWTLLFEASACSFSPVDGLVWGRGALIETGGERRAFLGCCRPAPEALR